MYNLVVPGGNTKDSNAVDYNMQGYLHTHSETVVMAVCIMIEGWRIVLLSSAYVTTGVGYVRNIPSRMVSLNGYADTFTFLWDRLGFFFSITVFF